MTDELMIQPQVQPRKQANPLVYGTLGAAAGLGVGALINRTEFIKGKQIGSVQDIINDANSKDKAEFSTKYSSAPEATRENLMAEAANVKKLKDELKNLPEKVLPEDSAEAKALKAAKEKRDAEFDRLLEIEKSKGGSSYVTGGKFPSEKTLKSSLTYDEYNIAKDYLRDYERARRNLFGRPGTGFAGGTASAAYNDYKNAKSRVENVYDRIYTQYKALPKKKKAEFDPREKFSKGEIKNYINSILPETGYQAKIGNSYSKFLELQEKFGEEIFSLVDEKPTRSGPFDKTPIISVRKDGKTQWVQIDYNAIKEKRNALFDEMAENVNRMNELNEKAEKCSNTFFKNNKPALKYDLYSPITKQSEIATKLRKPADYTKELKDIDWVKDGFERKSLNYPQTYTTMFGTTIQINNKSDLSKLDKYRRQTQAGLDLSSELWKEAGSIIKEAGEIATNDPVVAGARKKFGRVVSEDKGIKNVFQKMERELSRRGNDKEKAVYDKIMEMVGDTATVEGDIESRAKEAVENKMKGGSFESAVEKAQKAYDAALGKSGVANTEARSALESKISTAEGKIRQIAEEMCKKGGKSPWLAPIIGGVALGLAGLGIANSKNS